MKAYVSLLSADLLDMRRSIDAVQHVADGFHIDVTDGHLVPQLLFGPDFVRAVRSHTAKPIDVHLLVAHADRWVEPFVDAGADMVTVHNRSCPSLDWTLGHIVASGAAPALALEIDEPVEVAIDRLDSVDRILMMGTVIGIWGGGIKPDFYERASAMTEASARSIRQPEVFVGGGICADAVRQIAGCGVDGVIPGSLVYDADDPEAMVEWIHSQGFSST